MSKPKQKSNVAFLSRTPKIEKNVPVPSSRHSGEFNFMLSMAVKDSFFLSDKLWDVKKAIGNARNFAGRNKMEVTVRTQENGARVWRVK